MLPGLCSLAGPIFRPGMASAAPFPTVLVLHARVTVQMIALSASERGQSTERVMQLSQGGHYGLTGHSIKKLKMPKKSCNHA